MFGKLSPVDLIEMAGAILGASTTRLLLDLMQKKNITIASVLFQYVSGTLAGYLAYTFLVETPPKLIYVSVITLLSGDIVRYLVSNDGVKKVRELLITLFNLK